MIYRQTALMIPRWASSEVGASWPSFRRTVNVETAVKCAFFLGKGSDGRVWVTFSGARATTAVMTDEGVLSVLSGLSATREWPCR